MMKKNKLTPDKELRVEISKAFARYQRRKISEQVKLAMTKKKKQQKLEG